MHLVERRLIVGVGMHRRHEAFFDADGIVQHLRHRRQAIGRAGSVGDDRVFLRQRLVVHAEHDGAIRAIARGRDENALGARRQMGRGLFLRCEDARAFQRDVHAQFLVRKLGRVFHRRHLDLVPVDDHQIAVHLHLAGEPAVNRVVTQQMRVRFDRTQIVHPYHDDVVALGFNNCAQDQTSDAAEAVDRDAKCHSLSPHHGRAASEAKCDPATQLSVTSSMPPWLLPPRLPA